jgi:cytochrome bd-type quinol oxidase subunit 2
MLSVFGDHRWTIVFPLVVTAGVVGQFVFQRREQWLRAFGCSALFIVGLLTTMAAGLSPFILPARKVGRSG